MPDPDRPTAHEGQPPVGTSITPAGRGYRRAVPPRMDASSCERLRWLLNDPDHWVLRTSWERYLRTGDEALLVRTDQLTQDQCSAAVAWLRQQRHALYRALEGGERAPDGWLEQLPMLQAFTRHRAPTAELEQIPRQPGGPAPSVAPSRDAQG